jgi:TolA-binding protein
MKKRISNVLVIALFAGNLCYSQETAKELYKKAEMLYGDIPGKTHTIKNIPKYKEITDLLEQITEKKQTAGTELLQKTYHLMIDSYDKQARYPEKHNAIKQYAILKYLEEKEQQAQWLKQQADKLMEEGETAEAIILYRMTAREYPETEIAAASLFIAAEIIEKEEKRQIAATQTIKEYETLIAKYSKTEYAEESYLALVKQYQLKQDYNKAIQCLNTFLTEYPESKKYESILFQLGILYQQNKKEGEAKKVWDEYLKKYPAGLYFNVVKTFIGGESE